MGIKHISSLLILFLFAVSPIVAEEPAWVSYDMITGEETTYVMQPGIALELEPSETLQGNSFLTAGYTKQIVGPDGRVEITGRAPSSYKPAVVLEMQFSGNKKSICSGTMVGKNLVLTAGHCLYNDLGHMGMRFAESVTVRAVGLPMQQSTPIRHRRKDANREMKKPSDTFVSPLPLVALTRVVAEKEQQQAAQQQDGFVTAKSKNLLVPREYQRQANSGNADNLKGFAYDYGIVVLDKNIGKQTGWLGVRVPSNGEMDESFIITLGRGADKPDNSLWASFGKICAVEREFIRHNADTVGGNSGGPIIQTRDNRYIVAVTVFDKKTPSMCPNGGLRITSAIVNLIKQAQEKYN